MRFVGGTHSSAYTVMNKLSQEHAALKFFFILNLLITANIVS
ncbi:MAG: hypothetical protein [Olavius algarvensis spirochete endosymbiont]|nr:MAG: hypothetical protein [Olavius algarvensis spirochete endosymbiont]